jgi:hypothetical protein
MSRRRTRLLGWIAGIAGSVITAVILFFLIEPGGLLNPDPESPSDDGKATADEGKVWRQGTLAVPVSAGDRGQVADLDAGRLLPLGTSIPAGDADLSVRQAVHGIVIEPGLSKGDGVTFSARFVRVGDAPAGRDGCAAAAISPAASNHLQLSSDLHAGSFVCLITTQGRVAEFEVVKFDESRREVTIAFTVWER